MIEQINEQAQDEYNAVTERQMLELQKRQLEESDDAPYPFYYMEGQLNEVRK